MLRDMEPDRQEWLLTAEIILTWTFYLLFTVMAWLERLSIPLWIFWWRLPSLLIRWRNKIFSIYFWGLILEARKQLQLKFWTRSRLINRRRERKSTMKSARLALNPSFLSSHRYFYSQQFKLVQAIAGLIFATSLSLKMKSTLLMESCLTRLKECRNA